MIDFVGHLGYILIMVGMFLIAKRNDLGFLFRIMGGCIWIALGFIMNMSSIWAWGIIIVLMDVYGYVQWSTKGE